MTPPEAGPFSGPTTTRVSGLAACSELGRPPAACLATRRGTRPGCVRPTSASHCFRLRAPAPRELPASLRGLRLALDRGLAPANKRPVDPAFHDAESASVGFHGFFRSVSFFRAPHWNRTSDIPVASDLAAPAFATALQPICRGRCARPSVKRERGLRPGMPFIDRCESTRMRKLHGDGLRSRDVFRRYLCAQPPFRPQLLWHCSRTAKGLLQARLPSLGSFHASRFSRAALVPTSLSLAAARRLLQLHYYATRGRALEPPIFVFTSRRRRLQPTSNLPCPSPAPFPELANLPSRRRRQQGHEPRQTFRNCSDSAASTLSGHHPENYRPIATSLAGDATTQPPLATVAVGRQRWSARAG